METIICRTQGERLYNITLEVKKIIKEESRSGMLYLFCPHTSCGLTISEAFDPSAARDITSFYKHVAPRSMSFIEHTCEGPDDSPSHMKASLLGPQLNLFVEKGELVLGTWQGVFLAEFRDGVKNRKIHLKFVADA